MNRDLAPGLLLALLCFVGAFACLLSGGEAFYLGNAPSSVLVFGVIPSVFVLGSFLWVLRAWSFERLRRDAGSPPPGKVRIVGRVEAPGTKPVAKVAFKVARTPLGRLGLLRIARSRSFAIRCGTGEVFQVRCDTEWKDESWSTPQESEVGRDPCLFVPLKKMARWVARVVPGDVVYLLGHVSEQDEVRLQAKRKEPSAYRGSTPSARVGRPIIISHAPPEESFRRRRNECLRKAGTFLLWLVPVELLLFWGFFSLLLWGSVETGSVVECEDNPAPTCTIATSQDLLRLPVGLPTTKELRWGDSVQVMRAPGTTVLGDEPSVGANWTFLLAMSFLPPVVCIGFVVERSSMWYFRGGLPLTRAQRRVLCSESKLPA